MGTRQARLQRQIEAAQNRYVITLLAVGVPPAVKYDARYAGRSGNISHYWYDHDYRDRVRSHYIAIHQGTPAPGVKTIKKFVRGYMAWLRREIAARSNE